MTHKSRGKVTASAPATLLAEPESIYSNKYIDLVSRTQTLLTIIKIENKICSLTLENNIFNIIMIRNGMS